MHHTEKMPPIVLFIFAMFVNLVNSKVKHEDDYYNSNEYVVDEGGGGGGGGVGIVGNNIPVFEKCCREGQILDLSTMTCIWTRVHREAAVPTFASEYVFYEHMGIESPDTPELPEFQLSYKKDDGLLDSCHRSREDLGYRLKKNNDIRDVDSLYDNYIIDDLNFTGKLYQLVDMTDKRKYTRYCVDAGYLDGSFQGTAAVFCKERNKVICEEKQCLSLCFKTQQYFEEGNGLQYEPAAVRGAWNNISFVNLTDDGQVTQLTSDQSMAWDHLYYLYDNRPSCDLTKIGVIQDFTVIAETGEALVGGDSKKPLKYNQYCIGRYGSYPINETDPSVSLRAFVCPAPADEYFIAFDLTIVPILCAISLVFLAALFIYLACLKPRQRFREQQLRRMQQRGLDVKRLPPSAVAAKPQIVIGLFEAMTLSLVAMLFFFYFFLIVGKTAQKPLLFHFYPGCIANGLLLQYCYLSGIFWLHAMNFHVWRGLRSMRPDPDIQVGGAGGSRGRQGWRNRRFKRYAIYAWLGPTILIAVTVFMQYFPSPSIPDSYRPGLGVHQCFLADTWPARFLYMNVAVLPLAASNAIFFVSSTWSLCCGIWASDPQVSQKMRVSASSASAGLPPPTINNRNPQKARDTSRKRLKAKYITIIKMFFAMGIPWTAELASYLITVSYGKDQFKYLRTFFDTINSLQGLILFCVGVIDVNKLECACCCCCRDDNADKGAATDIDSSSTAAAHKDLIRQATLSTALPTSSSGGGDVWRRFSAAVVRTISGSSSAHAQMGNLDNFSNFDQPMELQERSSDSRCGS